MTHESSIKSKLSRSLRAALVMGSVTAIAMGGCSSSEEKRRASLLAGGCIINSDCDPDFICAFERCHIPCKQDRDCEADLRCVKSEVTGIFVCQLEDERHCKDQNDCPGEQVCGVDEECRDACQEHDDCIGDQICAASNECASTVSSKDMLDADGSIIPDPDPSEGGSGGTNGSGATSGSGPTSGSSGNGGNGATTPTDGGNGSEPIAGTGTGGTETTGGTGAQGGDSSQAGATSSEGGGPSYPPAEYEELPDVAEPVENDSELNAVPITESANLYLAGTDIDWLSYTAPSDGRAHIVTLHIDQEANLSGHLHVRAAADFSEIYDTNLGTGVTRDLYLTLGSGATALFKFSRYSIANTKGMAFITLSDVPEADDYEPNNTKEAAETIALDQTVAGQVLNPFVADNDRPAEDWFAIDLAVGTATFNLLSAPSEGRVLVQVLKPTAGTLPSNAGTVPAVGAVATYNVTVTAQTAGIHYFIVKPYSGIAGVSFNEKPKYLTEQYSFSITQ